MADSIPQTFQANPSWSTAQKAGFYRTQEALPIALSYLGEEIPVLDNHSNQQLVDEVGVLKQAKKILEKAEKAHVERLKVRMNNLPLPLVEGTTPQFGVDSLKGDQYEATYRGTKRTILNQEACKEIIKAFDEEGISIKRLLELVKKQELNLTGASVDVVLKEGETNHTVFHTTADGGRSLYVDPIA